MNKIVRICVAGKPLEDSVSMFIYMDQEIVNFAWQGNRQDGPRLSSFMLWV